jgi:hypothetical protein
MLTLAIPATAARRQEGNPELKYYADAYADHYGVPRALVHAIIAQESNWNPHGLSNKGAAGLMQLMPATADVYLVRKPLFCNGKSQWGDSIPRRSHNRVSREMRLAVAAYYCGSRHIARQGLNYRNSGLSDELGEVTVENGSTKQLASAGGAMLPTVSSKGDKLAYSSPFTNSDIWRRNLLQPESLVRNIEWRRTPLASTSMRGTRRCGRTLADLHLCTLD